MKNEIVLVGHNISHSKSPKLYNDFFDKNNLNWYYDIFDTDNLSFFIDNLKNTNIKAFNITMPFKKEILNYIDTFDEISKNSNSCNFVIIKNNKLYGYSTDGIGLFNSLIKCNVELKNKNIAIIGNGGAGRAIKETAKKYDIDNIFFITHNDSNNFFNLINNDDTNEKMNLLLNSEIIINASNVGFALNNNIPLPIHILEKIIENKKINCFVDIIYHPPKTPLLKFFEEHNVKYCFNGEPMLLSQVEANLNLLFDKKFFI